MSKRPSKAERKRLRREAEEEVRQSDHPAVVFAENASYQRLPPSRITRDLKKLRVSLRFQAVADQGFVLAPSKAPPEVQVHLYYGVVTPELSADLINLDDLRESTEAIPLGAPCIAISTQAMLHPANDFIRTAVLRSLGRLTHGTLADLSRGFVMDDWVSWSLDYMDPDMFKVKRLYDSDAPDPQSVLAEIPSLRAKKLWPFV